VVRFDEHHDVQPAQAIHLKSAVYTPDVLWHVDVKGPKAGAHYADRVRPPSICYRLSSAKRAGADAPPAPDKPELLHIVNEYAMLIEQPAHFGTLSAQATAEPKGHVRAGVVSDCLILDAEEVPAPTSPGTGFPRGGSSSSDGWTVDRERTTMNTRWSVACA
jgi:hypothetical protein